MLNLNINENTLVTQGMQISKNFILAHTSSGSYHYVLGRIVPQFTAFLRPGASTLPPWQVAANLQMGAQGILENLLSEFGGDLIIRSGFRGINDLGTIANQTIGRTFDVQVRGYESNMYNVANSIQQLTKRASSLQLVYGNSSFMRINFDEKSIKNNVMQNILPQMTSVDPINNILERGLTSIAGL